ncbi:MAG: M16 family metallopeptidase [Elsteraceae bacterium]
MLMKRLVSLSLLVVALLWSGPSAAKLFDPAVFTLSNGLQVVVVTNMRAPVVTHMVWYKVGAADEPRGKSGIAHYLEHLMFKGTDKLAPGEFSRTVARNGGRDNAFTSWDYTAYFQDIAVDRLPVVMAMEADRMANLRLTEAVALPERDVVLQERRQVVDSQPGSALSEQVNAALYLNHPYRLPIIGWEHEIRGLTYQDALDFYRQWYAPNNAIVVIAGGIEAQAALKLAETFYGPIPSRPVPPRVRLQDPPRGSAARIEASSERVRQVSWSRRHIAPSYQRGQSEHAMALQVLSEVLGGPTGRLNRALVQEQQLAISISAGYDPTPIDMSTFSIFASPRANAAGDGVAELEAGVDRVIDDLLKNGATQEEVTRAINRSRNAALYALDSLPGAARTLGVALATGGGLAQVEEWPERLAAVTAEQVTAAARAVLKRDVAVTSVLRPGSAF